MGPDAGVHRCKVCDKVGTYSYHTGRANKWGVMRDGEQGWFFQFDAAYCPEHVPEWVPEWRAKKAADKARAVEEAERLAHWATLDVGQKSSDTVE